MSTTHKPALYAASTHHARTMAILYGCAAAVTIIMSAVLVLASLEGNGGLERCQARHSQDTCLYAMR